MKKIEAETRFSTYLIGKLLTMNVFNKYQSLFSEVIHLE